MKKIRSRAREHRKLEAMRLRSDENLTNQQIADKMGLSLHTICDYFRTSGLSRRCDESRLYAEIDRLNMEVDVLKELLFSLLRPNLEIPAEIEEKIADFKRKHMK